MKIIDPNNNAQVFGISVFLAGGCTKEGWRDTFFKYINGFILNSLIIFDPYNENIQDNYHQIKWEQDKIQQCDILSVYFDKYTEQPISMLELGRMLELAKDKSINIETPLGTSTIYVNYGKPLIVGIHPEAPKKNDILIQMELLGHKAEVCTPEQHATNIISAYEQIKSRYK